MTNCRTLQAGLKINQYDRRSSRFSLGLAISTSRTLDIIVGIAQDLKLNARAYAPAVAWSWLSPVIGYKVPSINSDNRNRTTQCSAVQQID